MKAVFKKHNLRFKFSASTSRGAINERSVWYLLLSDKTGKTGLGEAAPLSGLSVDSEIDFEENLQKIAKILEDYSINDFKTDPDLPNKLISRNLPSIRFAVEKALLDLQSDREGILFKNKFTESKKKLPVNGLVWMGSYSYMKKQVEQKLSEGYRCIKIKVGAIDFDSECKLLHDIRKKYSADKIELRVDANGAFTESDIVYKLQELSGYNLHSIEQPVATSKKELMTELCKTSPVDIALDEQLIGVFGETQKRALLQSLKPKYIVLKPTLLGGFAETEEWIRIAKTLNIGWWITSALESNIGLNAIAQFTANFPVKMAQGFGTGQLYLNNASAPLSLKEGFMSFNPHQPLDLPKDLQTDFFSK